MSGQGLNIAVEVVETDVHLNAKRADLDGHDPKNQTDQRRLASHERADQRPHLRFVHGQHLSSLTRGVRRCQLVVTGAADDPPAVDQPDAGVPLWTSCDDDAVSDREHADRCPGVLRPWIADDGALIRLRLVGGALTAQMLTDLMAISAEWADGTVLLTKRANLQLRGLAATDGCVDPGFVDAVKAAGFLPSPTHELVRNVMVSPLSGRFGGRADLFPVALQLDEALRADPTFAGLSARFLFVLDDGRGDLIDRKLDLGAMAVDTENAQIRIGSQSWGEVVELDAVPEVLLDLAQRFVHARGDGPDAPWHVDELPEPLVETHHARDLRTQVTSLRLPAGSLVQADGRTAEVVDVPDGILTHDLATRVLSKAERDVIVTPWRSLVLVDLGQAEELPR